MNDFRVELDSMGDMQVPADRYFGAQTQRAVENLAISGLRFSRPFIRAVGIVKLCAARVNSAWGLLKVELARAIEDAADEVIAGNLDDQFVVDVFHSGSQLF